MEEQENSTLISLKKYWARGRLQMCRVGMYFTFKLDSLPTIDVFVDNVDHTSVSGVQLYSMQCSQLVLHQKEVL